MHTRRLNFSSTWQIVVCKVFGRKVTTVNHLFVLPSSLSKLSVFLWVSKYVNQGDGLDQTQAYLLQYPGIFASLFSCLHL